jgi:hypothetical protein
MSYSKQDAIQKIVDQLNATPLEELSEKLKDIRELRTGERKPKVPLLFGYPSTESEINAYERIISTLRRKTRAAMLPNHSAPFNVLATHFGGQPYAIAGDAWPICPSCERSLNFVCQISTGIPFGDGTREILLYTVYYCFRCKPEVTAQGMGYVIGIYWNPRLDAAVPIAPTRKLSAEPIYAQAPIWVKDVYYLPSIREADVEEMGVDIQYYLRRFEDFIGSVSESTHIIDSGPYPGNAQFIHCEQCTGLLEVTYTIFLDGIFSIICCPKHPHFVFGYHTNYDDCAVGPVKYEVLS